MHWNALKCFIPWTARHHQVEHLRMSPLWFPVPPPPPPGQRLSRWHRILQGGWKTPKTTHKTRLRALPRVSRVPKLRPEKWESVGIGLPTSWDPTALQEIHMLSKWQSDSWRLHSSDRSCHGPLDWKNVPRPFWSTHPAGWWISNLRVNKAHSTCFCQVILHFDCSHNIDLLIYWSAGARICKEAMSCAFQPRYLTLDQPNP